MLLDVVHLNSNFWHTWCLKSKKEIKLSLCDWILWLHLFYYQKLPARVFQNEYIRENKNLQNLGKSLWRIIVLLFKIFSVTVVFFTNKLSLFILSSSVGFLWYRNVNDFYFSLSSSRCKNFSDLIGQTECN